MDKDRIHILFERYLKNELSNEELEEFIKLLESASFDKQKMLDEVFNSHWILNEKFKNRSSDQGSKRIAKTIQSISGSSLKQNQQKGRKIKFLLTSMVAASILLLFFGIIYWQRLDSNQKLSEISRDHELVVVHVPLGKKKKIALPDSSIVFLNGGSTLTYDKAFNQTQRALTLDGEGFFSVQSNPDKPFIIVSGETYIQVLGTSFNIKSYREDHSLEVAVTTGIVEVGKMSVGKVKEKIFDKLKANQYLHYDEKSDLYQIERNKNSNTLSAWKDQKLIFDNQAFGLIAKELKRWYGYNIEFKNQELKKINFSGEFDKLDIKSLLEILKASYPFEYQIDNKNIYIN